MKQVAFLVAAATFAVLGATCSAQADGLCTLASLNGQCTYQAVTAPSTTGAKNGAGPIAIVGQMSFDGAGNVKMDQHANVDGVYHENENGAGTYTINPDCDGVISLTFPIPGGSQTVAITFVRSPSGNTLRTINSASSDTPTGPMNQVTAGICRFDE
jgi:hypothetical protein